MLLNSLNSRPGRSVAAYGGRRITWAFDSFPKYTVEGVESLVVLDLTTTFAETCVESVEVRPLPTPRRVEQNPVAMWGAK